MESFQFRNIFSIHPFYPLLLSSPPHLRPLSSSVPSTSVFTLHLFLKPIAHHISPLRCQCFLSLFTFKYLSFPFPPPTYWIFCFSFYLFLYGPLTFSFFFKLRLSRASTPPSCLLVSQCQLQCHHTVHLIIHLSFCLIRINISATCVCMINNSSLIKLSSCTQAHR